MIAITTEQLQPMNQPEQAELFALPKPRRATPSVRVPQLRPVNSEPVAPRQSERPPLWLCIELPWLALQAVFDVGRVSGPAAVYQRQSGRDQIVVGSRLARHHGVSVGMSLSQAYALSPQLQALPRDVDRERRIADRVAAIAYGFSAQVGVLDAQAVVIELGRSLRWFGCNRLLRDLRRRLDCAGHVARIGIAPSVEAARLLATTQQQSLDHQQTIGLLRLRSITELPISAKQRQAMRACGLKQLGDLLRLPNGSVRRRFGDSAADFIEALTQSSSPSVEIYQPPLRFEEALELPAPSINSTLVATAADRLLQALHAFLLRHDKAVSACQLRLELDRGQSSQTIDLGLRRISGELSYLQLVLGEKLERLALTAPVVRVVLSTDQFADYPAEQTALFDAGQSTRGDVAQWLDQLSARLGAEHMHTVGTVADHRPECSYRLQAPGRPTDDSYDSRHDFRTRPLWLLPKPKLLESIAGIEWLKGPERIESGWWDGRDCRRDYYVARDCRGRRIWVCLDFKLSGWFLYGVFG